MGAAMHLRKEEEISLLLFSQHHAELSKNEFSWDNEIKIRRYDDGRDFFGEIIKMWRWNFPHDNAEIL